MDKEPKTNTDNENLRDLSQGDGDTTARQAFHNTDNSGSESFNDERSNTDDERHLSDIDDTDKYLAMEQPGITYTQDSEPANLSDQLNYDETDNESLLDAEAGNGTYSDAFSQDDYILTDNIDLDEDQNQSISTDDEDFEESNERYTN